MEFVRKAITLSHTFIILIVVGIAFTCHNEWQEVDNRRIDEFRKEVNRIHIQLIEFSLLGETVLDWDETDLENYHAQRITLDRTLYLFFKFMQLDVSTVCVVFWKIRNGRCFRLFG